jgi:hypothetical protein
MKNTSSFPQVHGALKENLLARATTLERDTWLLNPTN